MASLKDTTVTSVVATGQGSVAYGDPSQETFDAAQNAFQDYFMYYIDEAGIFSEGWGLRTHNNGNYNWMLRVLHDGDVLANNFQVVGSGLSSVMEEGSDNDGSWIKFYSGLMIQRFYSPGNNSASLVTTSLPTPFINTDYYCVATVNGEGNNDYAYGVIFDSLATGSVGVRVNHSGNGGTKSSWGASCIAIGFWK